MSDKMMLHNGLAKKRISNSPNSQISFTPAPDEKKWVLCKWRQE